jgi:hypothetical protein
MIPNEIYKVINSVFHVGDSWQANLLICFREKNAMLIIRQKTVTKNLEKNNWINSEYGVFYGVLYDVYGVLYDVWDDIIVIGYYSDKIL